MDIKEQIEQDCIQGMKEKDLTQVGTLRMLKSELKNREIREQKELKKEEIISCIQAQIKSRQESIEAFKKGNRPELAEKEQKEIEILKKYLPEQLSQEEITAQVEKFIRDVSAQGPQDIGRVMAAAAAKLRGKADMSLVSQIVKETLKNEN